MTELNVSASSEPGAVAGGLSPDALREIWCWLWAGIAERECRIWREFSSSRDIRKEKQACLEVRRRLLTIIPGPEGADPDDVPHERLAVPMPPSVAADLLEELRDWFAEARTLSTGKEIGGNDWDALEFVLAGLLPIIERHMTLRAVPTPGSTTAGSLSPAAAFDFHLWLASNLDMLEDVLGLEGLDPNDKAEWTDALPAFRMALAQWVSILPPAGEGGHNFHSTHARLALGVDDASVRHFAGWLGAMTSPKRIASSGARKTYGAVFRALARSGGMTFEELKAMCHPSPPPWTPPDPLPRAFLGGDPTPGAPIVITLVETSHEDRWKVPLHQFLAALVRR